MLHENYPRPSPRTWPTRYSASSSPGSFLFGLVKVNAPTYLPTYFPTSSPLLVSAHFAYIRSLVVQYLDEAYSIDQEISGSLSLFGVVGGGHKTTGYINTYNNTQYRGDTSRDLKHRSLSRGHGQYAQTAAVWV